MVEKHIFGIKTVKELFHKLDFPAVQFSEEDLNYSFMPEITSEKLNELRSYFTISPLQYFKEKIDFEENISNGSFVSFIDILKKYNLLDCELLMEAMKKFIAVFKNCFNVFLLDKLSLPSISEQIMWERVSKLFYIDFH